MKKITFLALLLAISIAFCGCFFPFGLPEGIESLLEQELEGSTESSEQEASGAFDTENSEQSIFSESIDESFDISLPEESLGDIGFESESDEMPDIASLTELRDYLNGKKAGGEFELEFRYTGAPEEVNGETLARITSACCITWWLNNGNEYRIIIYEYPGDRIADAYFSGDSSDLSYDEKRTLAEAEKILEAARAEADSEFELELLLHDAIAERVTYFNGSTEVPDAKNPPRHLTAVGALLDKKANCQGYTDAFYLLATMAGFKVGRMNVYNSDGWHIANTVFIDGEWYIVDVTFDDSVVYTDGVQPSYRLFNAGRDMCLEYEWGEEMEYYPIADETDENYFYFNDAKDTEFYYEKAFQNVEMLAESIVNEYLNGGNDEYQTVVLGANLDWSVLGDALNNVDTNGVRFRYTIWAYSNGRDTFFLVRFE